MKTRTGALFSAGLGLIAAASTPSAADITYIGNGTMPDFPQVWSATQMNKAICQAASSADVMWYWDQNGYSGLVSHQDPKNPNNTWEADGQTLVYSLAGYLYGRDPGTGKISPNSQASPFAALGKYIKNQNQYATQANPNGLVVDYYQAGNGTYANWTKTIGNGAVDIAGMSWTDPKGGSIAQHSMASAGVDSTGDNLIVTHGWDSHPFNLPPYAAPPYAAGQTPYINQYPMELSASGKAVIPNPGDGSVDLFGGAKYGAAPNMTMFEFYAVHPKAKAAVKMKQAQSATNGFDNTYNSDVSNDSFEPIYQYIQEVDTPIDAASAPPGWTAVSWSFANTPDVTAPAYESAQPPDENDPLQDILTPPLNGVLWYTTTNPIMPGDDLENFDFDTSGAYSAMADDSMSFISDGVSASLDSNTTGLTSELLFPTLVPEPGAVLLIAAAFATEVCARRRRISRRA